MNLRDELDKMRQKLKPATTKVTTCEGYQYIEPSLDSGAHEMKSIHGNRPPNLTIHEPVSPGYVIDNTPDLQVGLVTDNLLIGSIDAAMDVSLLREMNVSHILTVASIPSYLPPLGLCHKALDILDLPETELAQYFDVAFAFIDDVAVGSRVLVHCNAGVSRAAAIVIAYVMKHEGITYEEAFNLVKSKRPAINPNIGFILQLKQYEKQLRSVANRIQNRI